MSLSESRLRAMRYEDLNLVLTWRNHPDVRRYMYTQRLISAEEHSSWFERSQQMPRRHLLIYEQNELPRGVVNFTIVDEQAQRAEWGFYLAPSAPRGSGRRLGTSALSYAFGKLALHKLCGEVLSQNRRSLRFHENLGFRREGTLRHHFHDGQIHHDVIVFGLLAEEWLAVKGADSL